MSRSQSEISPTIAPIARRSSSRALPGGAPSARDVLLAAAVRLFCRNGINATGIDAIVAEAGVARMTVYNQFGSKERLVSAALEREGDAWRSWFFARLAQIPGGPRDRMLGIFDVLEEWFSREDYFGCALMNAIVEHRNQHDEIRRVTFAHKARVLEQIQALASAAGATDVAGLAGQIDLLMDGAIVKSMVKRSPEAAREGKAIALALCAAHNFFETDKTLEKD